MRRFTCTPRPDFRDRVMADGMVWPDETRPDGRRVPYWTDAAYYSFEPAEIDRLEDAVEQLWPLCVEAAHWMARHWDDRMLGLAPGSMDRIRASLERADPGLYARFDLCLTPDGTPKLLELNGDTPTMLIESAVAQWTWHEQVRPGLDQWNSVHERLVAQWDRVTAAPFVHLAGVLTSDEEAATLAYLADTAQQAGRRTRVFDLRDLGRRMPDGRFVDDLDAPIDCLFKLYPWEDLLAEPFGPFAATQADRMQWVEPIWKSLLSTKALLAALWQLHPGHELLLPAYLDGPRDLEAYVVKPLHGREGANIEIHAPGTRTRQPGDYGAEGWCWQQWCPLPDHDGNRPVLGAWVIDGYAAGLGIRESDGPITDGDARFVPHVIETAAPTAQQRHDWLAQDGAARG